ncbi:MAG: alpha/beta hydrolase [Saprospiraceae bacterium]|nr:alpha/beta hydrolase [Saprospiraceae bacterium]
MRRILRFTCYSLLVLLLTWIIAMQSGCMDMRTPNSAWAEQLRAKGQVLVPQFLDVASSTGRSIHAVAVITVDSLPWVFMLHGSPGSADAYLDYLADTSLSHQANLVAIDRAGFGYSDYGKAETSLQRQAADVKAVADRLAPGRKILLVGHSLGSPVIFRFAMDYPDQTAGIVNVAGSVDAGLEPHPWWQSVLDVPPMSWLLPGSFWASNHEIRYLAPELKWMEPLWANIRCPVEIVHAQDDSLVPAGNVDFCKKMLVGAANVKVNLLPTGDHFILWSRRDVVIESIVELLKG